MYTARQATFGDSVTTPNGVTMRANLLALYRSATLEERRAGRQWYRRARARARNIARTTGRDPVHVCYAIAALSPLCPWDANMRYTAALASRRRFRNPGTFTKFARDAWEILERGALERCSGAKRQPFARAIAGDVSAVTIDRWIVRAVGMDYRNAPTTAQYRQITTALESCAREVGEFPRAFQAIVWVRLRDRRAQLDLPVKGY
jgi:hypothetical protein